MRNNHQQQHKRQKVYLFTIMLIQIPHKIWEGVAMAGLAVLASYGEIVVGIIVKNIIQIAFDGNILQTFSKSQRTTFHRLRGTTFQLPK